MKKARALSFALTILLAALADAQDEKFAIAIVRANGGLIPFASYAGGQWTKAWPEADEALEPTPNIENVPSVWLKRGERVPNRWWLWPITGDKPIQTKIKGVEVTDAHCQGQVALTTTLPTKEGYDHLKLGVAVDSDRALGRIEEVNRADADWKAAQKVITASFSRLEATKAAASNQRLIQETPSPAPEIRTLYREAKSSQSPLYFTAVKKYRTRDPRDPRCEILTIMTGWLSPGDNGNMSLIAPKVYLTNCDAMEVDTALPLAVIRAGGRLFWVLQEHGYEDEKYVVAEIAPVQVRYVISVNGGGC
jgi:hypothetical protein